MKGMGFVLLTTMLMLMVSSLMILTLMKTVLLYVQQSRDAMTHHQVLQQLEQAANQLQQQTASCVFMDTGSNQVIVELRNQKGCQFSMNEHEYRYWISDLGMHPCLPMVQKSIFYSSHHWLMSILNVQFPQVVLQVRWATMSHEVSECQRSDVREMRAMNLSWRWVMD